MKRPNRLWWYLIPLLLVTFWLGARYLDERPIWEDDAYSITDAGGTSANLVTPADIWQEVGERNPWHPPGYFIILNAWSRLVGWSPAALRVLALSFGLLAVAWTYRLGRDHVSPQVGLYGAIILGTTVMFSFYTVQIRVYSLLTALSAYIIWVYLHMVGKQTPPRRVYWIGLFVGTACLPYAHYFGTLILVPIGLYHLLFVPKNRRWWMVVGVMAAAALTFLPWVNVLIQGLNMFLTPHGFQDRALTNTELILVLAGLLSNGAIMLLGVVLVMALLARKRGAWRIWFFAVTMLATMLLLNGLFRAIPITRMRYLLILWPLFALIAALGITWLNRWRRWGRWASFALLMLWAGAGIANADNPALIAPLGGGGDFFPFHKLARDMRSQMTADDLVVSYWPLGSARPNQAVLDYYGGLLLAPPVIISTDFAQPHDVPPDLLANSNRVWLTYMPERAAEEPQSLDHFQSVLSTDYQQCRVVRDTPDLRMVLYARTALCCEPQTGAPPLATFGSDMIALGGVDGLPATVTDRVSFSLNWLIGPTVPIQVYSITLQVFDATGSKVAQSDYGLPPGDFICRTSAIDTSGLEAGEYDVRVGVYAWQTQQRLSGTASDGTQADLIPMGKVQIRKP